MLGAIIIGILAGWLAGKLMRGSGYGILGDLVLAWSAAWSVDGSSASFISADPTAHLARC